MDCWPTLCTGSESNEYFSFGPVYAFTEKVSSTQVTPSTEQGFRVANFHVWFIATSQGATNDGTVLLDYTDIGLLDNQGQGGDGLNVQWPNPACLKSYPPGQPGLASGQYNLVQGAILSLPKDMCFGFPGTTPVTVATLNFLGDLNLTAATSTVPPSAAGGQ